MIRIQLLTGPQSGLQVTHTEPRITFGRAPGNTLSVDDLHLSRFHGELVYQSERWLLLNHSPNGTAVNRRVIAGKEPHPLAPGDVISVGSTRLFSVQFTPSAAGHADEPRPAAPEPPARRMTRRAKIWMAIGGYIAAIVAVMIVLSLRGGRGDQALAMGEELTPERIASVLRAAPELLDRDEREAARHIQEARAWFARIDTAPDAAYRSYHHYKLARLLQKGRLEDVDQLQFDAAEKQLVTRVTDQYGQAMLLLKNKEYNAAEAAFRKLLSIYPETSGELAQNIRHQLAYIDQFRPKRKFR